MMQCDRGFPSTSLRRCHTSLALAVSSANSTARSQGEDLLQLKNWDSGGSTASAGQRMPDRPRTTWSVPNDIS